MTGTLVSLHRTTSPAGFTHPGIGVTAGNLERARERVRAGAEPWKSYYDAMAATGYASRTLTSKNAGPEPDRPGTDEFTGKGTEAKLIEDSWGAHTQALLYFLTGDDVYRSNALKIIRIWSHMDPEKYAYYADSQIHTGVPLYRLLSAAEIIRYTSHNPTHNGYDLAWHDTDTAHLTANLIAPMNATFLYKNTHYFNQHSYPLTGALAGYIFTDDRARYDEGVEWFTVNATSERQEQNGAIAGVFRRIDRDDPLNPYGYSFVQHQEMTRDQAHSGGDVDTLTGIARIVSVQGTKVDPVHGTPSASAGAVTPYAFLGNRLLAGADAYARFMLGYETPWVDLTGGTGGLSNAYRGRLSDITEVDEIYDTYRYGEGVDVEKEAPYLAQAHRQANGPLYYRGGELKNYWGGIDTGPEYWLSFPDAIAGRTPPPAGDPRVGFAEKGVPLGGRTVLKSEGGRTYAEVTATRESDGLIAVHDLIFSDRSAYSPVGVLVRTRATATLEISKDQVTAPFRTLTLPNTHGRWRYVTYDMANATVPPNRTGDHIAYFRVVGKPGKPGKPGQQGATVDFDHVNVIARTQYTAPVFPQGDTATVVALRGVPLRVSFSATDGTSATSALTYEGDRLPKGAEVDAATGEFTWTPPAKDRTGADRTGADPTGADRTGADPTGARDLLIVAGNEVADTVLGVRVEVAGDRTEAYRLALAAYDEKTAYTTASLRAFRAVADEVRAEIPTASDSAYLASLARLRTAAGALRPVNPVLPDDGSLDYPDLVTSTLSPVSLRNMVDGDYTTFSGDLRAPFTLDFGADFRVSVTAFGIQARYMFANRSQGANVYGSEDGANWTLLTSRETTDTTAQDYALETIPTLPETRDTAFRYLKVQVDHPGIPTDPAYPGLSSFGELRIHGKRLEVTAASGAASGATAP
ncbi:discoidin domain-containing protein [Streptomyces sp. NPDC093085]|uniref:discoidin domain-containing protein n=1 Tax=Streptomyces sp. NPDC093085 TaxID=3155068 RepID=UPI003441CB8B